MASGYTITGVTTKDEGIDVGFAGIMNFTGAGVTATASGNVVTVDIPGEAAGRVTTQPSPTCSGRTPPTWG